MRQGGRAVTRTRGNGGFPTGARLYVSHPNGAHGVSVIDLATHSVSATIDSPEGALIGIDLGSVPGTSKVSCPAGSVLTGGGFESTGPAPDQLVSRPVPGTNDWEVNGQNRTRDDVTRGYPWIPVDTRGSASAVRRMRRGAAMGRIVRATPRRASDSSRTPRTPRTSRTGWSPGPTERLLLTVGPLGGDDRTEP